jgi:NAD(P)-dependent dehydrogenase (short-subunit alcohol dehydrogenase family)
MVRKKLMARTLVAVAGATGDLGTRIVKALIARQAAVRVLVRRGTPLEKIRTLEVLGAEIALVNFASPSTLVTACTGASCVVSALSGLRDVIVEAQIDLLNAAVQAGVPRFIPSDFSIDFTSIPTGTNRNLDLRQEFYERANQTPIAVTSILNGAFMDLLTDKAPIILFKQRRVVYWQNAEQRMDFTTMDDTAAYTAAAALDDTTPRILRIAGDTVNANELASIMRVISREDFTLFRPGGLSLLRALIWVTRTTAPSPKEIYPPWQGMQYLYNMFAGQGKFGRNDNTRYPEIQWQSVRDVLEQRPDLL